MTVFDKLTRFCVSGATDARLTQRLTQDFLAAAYYPRAAVVGGCVSRCVSHKSPLGDIDRRTDADPDNRRRIRVRVTQKHAEHLNKMKI